MVLWFYGAVCVRTMLVFFFFSVMLSPSWLRTLAAYSWKGERARGGEEGKEANEKKKKKENVAICAFARVIIPKKEHLLLGEKFKWNYKSIGRA